LEFRETWYKWNERYDAYSIDGLKTNQEGQKPFAIF
jgi:hypothetical protein